MFFPQVETVNFHFPKKIIIYTYGFCCLSFFTSFTVCINYTSQRSTQGDSYSRVRQLHCISAHSCRKCIFVCCTCEWRYCIYRYWVYYNVYVIYICNSSTHACSTGAMAICGSLTVGGGTGKSSLQVVFM